MSFRARLHAILETAAPHDGTSRAFDLALLALILINVVAAVLGTESALYDAAPAVFDGIETVSLWLFTAEYVARLWSCTAEPALAHPFWGRVRYATRPLAIVDLITVLPFLLQLTGVDTRPLRVLRLLRILRVIRLLRYVEAMRALGNVLLRRRGELLTIVFGFGILLLVVSSLMYLAERSAADSRLTSIPHAMWWGIVTLTTVGYGDVVPVTTLGRFLAGCTAVLGIGMFALPTSVIGAAFLDEIQERRRRHEHGPCPTCGRPR